MTETYGAYQEFAAGALHHLVATRSPVTPDEAPAVMQARHQMILTLRDRATLLGISEPIDVDPHRLRITVTGVARRPLWHVAVTLSALPTPEIGEGRPSEVLTIRPSDPPVVGAWRHAARALTLGTGALQRAETKPWHDDRSAAWHLLGDLAMTTAALANLDDRLGATGLLPRETGNARLGRQLALLDVARLAEVWGHNPVADTISPTVKAQTAGNASIRIVRNSEDLPGALISLAAALHGDPAAPGVTGAQTRAGLRALRAVAVGQAQLSLALARGAGASGDANMDERFRKRAHAYADLHRSTMGLVDHMPERGQRALLQQREVGLLVRRNDRLQLKDTDSASSALARLDRAVARRVEQLPYEGLIGAARQPAEANPLPQPPFLALERTPAPTASLRRERLGGLMRTLPGAPMRSLGR